MGKGLITYDGFESAELGLGVRCGFEYVKVYSFDKMIDVLVERDVMEEDEAEEFIDYNIIGAHLGERTPVIVRFDGELLGE